MKGMDLEAYWVSLTGICLKKIRVCNWHVFIQEFSNHFTINVNWSAWESLKSLRGVLDLFKCLKDHGMQGSTITIKLPYLITHVCQHFGVHNVIGQIKAYVRCHTFYLVIFVIICPKHVFNYIEWKIANSAKKKRTVWRGFKALFFSHF